MLLLAGWGYVWQARSELHQPAVEHGTFMELELQFWSPSHLKSKWVKNENGELQSHTTTWIKPRNRNTEQKNTDTRVCTVWLHLNKVQRRAKPIYGTTSQDRLPLERGMGGILSPVFFDLGTGDTGMFILWKFIELHIYDLRSFMPDHTSFTKKKVHVASRKSWGPGLNRTMMTRAFL